MRYTLAGNLMRIDNLKAAFTYSSEALALIPAEPPSRTWVWAAATHVMAARYVGRDEDAERVARQALEIAETLRLRDAQADLMISLVGHRGPQPADSGRAGSGCAGPASWPAPPGTSRWRCARCSTWPSAATSPATWTSA